MGIDHLRYLVTLLGPGKTKGHKPNLPHDHDLLLLLFLFLQPTNEEWIFIFKAFLKKKKKCNRDLYGPQSLKYFLFCPLQKRLPTPDLKEYVIFQNLYLSLLFLCLKRRIKSVLLSMKGKPWCSPYLCPPVQLGPPPSAAEGSAN